MSEGKSANVERRSSQGDGWSDDESSLLDIAIVLAKHKKLVLGLPLVAAFVAAVVTLFLPNIYTATAKILPPQQESATAALLLGSSAGSWALREARSGSRTPPTFMSGC